MGGRRRGTPSGAPGEEPGGAPAGDRSGGGTPAARFDLRPGVAVALLVGLVYLVVASDGTLRFRQSPFPYHVLIADGWLHGHLHVREEALELLTVPYLTRQRAHVEASYAKRGLRLTEAEWARILPSLRRSALHDWSVIDGKVYGYWGPAPAALLLPYVALAGPGASDRLAGALIGALTVFLLYLALREAGRLGEVAVTPRVAAAVALLFGLGTVHFYLAVAGQVWFLSQTVAAFFLTAAVWAALRSDRGWRWALVAGAAFGGALLARNSELAVAPFFPLALLAIARREPRGWPGRTLKLYAAFAAPVLAAGLVMLAYNDARFGSPFESGVRHQAESTGNPRFLADFRQYGMFDLHFLPRNAYHYFASARLLRDRRTGALTFDPDGNSMFLVTPALLLALRPLRRRSWLITAARVGAGTCLATLLCFYGTGWYNFGNRYLLDLLPVAMLLVAAGMRGKLSRVAVALIVASIAVNAWGSYRFFVDQA